MANLVVKSTTNKDIIDITSQISKNLENLENGVVVLTVLHTTAALTTADLDPGTDRDFLDFLAAITPEVEWRHPHDPAHAPAHLFSSLIGPSVTVPVQDDQLQLGTWQHIILVELDGPRERSISVVPLSS